MKIKLIHFVWLCFVRNNISDQIHLMDLYQEGLRHRSRSVI